MLCYADSVYLFSYNIFSVPPLLIYRVAQLCDIYAISLHDSIYAVLGNEDAVVLHTHLRYIFHLLT